MRLLFLVFTEIAKLYTCETFCNHKIAKLNTHPIAKLRTGKFNAFKVFTYLKSTVRNWQHELNSFFVMSLSFVFIVFIVGNMIEKRSELYPATCALSLYNSFNYHSP